MKSAQMDQMWFNLELAWVEAYPIYDNLSISKDDKKDPSKLLDAFECYFKPERNIFQSWYALGSIYSGVFKPNLNFIINSIV